MTSELLVQDRLLRLHAEARSARVARMLELARRCCEAVRPSRIARAVAGIQRSAALR